MKNAINNPKEFFYALLVMLGLGCLKAREAHSLQQSFMIGKIIILKLTVKILSHGLSSVRICATGTRSYFHLGGGEL